MSPYNKSSTFYSGLLSGSSKRSREHVNDDKGDGVRSGMSIMGSSPVIRLKLATCNKMVLVEGESGGHCFSRQVFN